MSLSERGIQNKARAISQFILDNKLMTSSKARAMFTEAEDDLTKLLADQGHTATDAATRAGAYLDALERSAARQGLNHADVSAIRNKAAELIQGPMGQDVLTMVAKPHPTLVDQFGKPIMRLEPKVTRQLRPAVPAGEALGSARSSGRWGTRKAWGELKGADDEARKAVERAQRTAVKNAVPAAKPILKKESMALSAETVLDRMEQRTMNRDLVSLPSTNAGAIAAATKSASAGVIAFASQWLRNNEVKAGVWADVLGKAIARKDAEMTYTILKNLNVSGIPKLAASMAE
jgi:hypothetical protein